MEIDTDIEAEIAPPIGPFEEAAFDARFVGFAPLPVGGEDGKTALLKGFTNWSGPPSVNVISEWCVRFGSANIAIATGAVSGLVVVDIDRLDLLDQALDAFGATPVQAGTPRTGRHLYYRNVEPVGCLDLRHVGAAIDIRGDGGYVVIPPSVRPDTGRAYEFVVGSLLDCRDLPPFRMSGLERFGYAIKHPTSRPHRDGLVGEGQRNVYLFDHLRRLSPFKSLDDIVDEARFYNRTQNAVPEDDAKVVATAKMVWAYQERGSLKRPAEAYVRVTNEMLDHLKVFAGDRYPDVLALYLELHRQHGVRARVGAPFALAVEAMAEARVVQGMKDRRRYEHARAALIKAGVLRLISPAGRNWNGERRPARYVLENPAVVSTGNSRNIRPSAAEANH